MGRDSPVVSHPCPGGTVLLFLLSALSSPPGGLTLTLFVPFGLAFVAALVVLQEVMDPEPVPGTSGGTHLGLAAVAGAVPEARLNELLGNLLVGRRLRVLPVDDDQVGDDLPRDVAIGEATVGVSDGGQEQPEREVAQTDDLLVLEEVQIEREELSRHGAPIWLGRPARLRYPSLRSEGRTQPVPEGHRLHVLGRWPSIAFWPRMLHHDRQPLLSTYVSTMDMEAASRRGVGLQFHPAFP